jgi:hypothetical protein
MNPACLGFEIFILGARLCFGQPQFETVTVPVCAVTTPRDRDFQARLSTELRDAPSGTPVESVLSEWISLRDQARACRKAR